jgi:hypothetical protein
VSDITVVNPGAQERIGSHLIVRNWEVATTRPVTLAELARALGARTGDTVALRFGTVVVSSDFQPPPGGLSVSVSEPPVSLGPASLESRAAAHVQGGFPAGVLAKTDGSDSGSGAQVAGFVRRSGRDSNPRGFRLAVFKPDAPVRGAWTVSVKQARVGPRVLATVMATRP